MKKIYLRIRNILSLLKNIRKYTNAKTYYKGCDLKSRFRITLDQIYITLKYGYPEPFYFTYGFDRKLMTLKKICSEYIIPYDKFQKRIDYLNYHNPRYDKKHEKLIGRTITADKFYFNIFLNHLGFPTPDVYLFIKDRHPLYIDERFEINKDNSPKEQIREFLKYEMDAFAKPSDGQLGNGIFALRVNNGEIFVDGVSTDIETVINTLMSADYLVQERITQHPAISKLCSTTLNTIRLQTVMDKNGDVIPFGAILRIAKEGSPVDNWAKGGIAVGINTDNGTLKKVGIIKPEFGTSTYEHPNSHIIFDGYKIPYYQQAEKLAVELHKRLYRCHSVGWDIAITENGPCFIEANGLWEVSLIQATNGGLKHIEKYFHF